MPMTACIEFSRADILIRHGVCGDRDHDDVRPDRTNGKGDAEMIPFPRESFRFTKRNLSDARAVVNAAAATACCNLLRVYGNGRRKDVVNVR